MDAIGERHFDALDLPESRPIVVRSRQEHPMRSGESADKIKR